jgi:cell envelope-related transcriptional attenuator-like protein
LRQTADGSIASAPMSPEDAMPEVTSGLRQDDVADRPGPRRWRSLLVIVALVAALAAGGSVLASRSYEGFRSQVAIANSRVTDAVVTALGTPPSRESPSTVLVAAPGGDVGSVVVMRTDPANHRNGVVLLSETLRMGKSKLGDLARTGKTPALIAGIRELGIPVDHVILIDPAKVRDLVDALGGVTISNPSRVLLEAGKLRVVVDQGEVTIDGRAAEAYARARKSPTVSTLRGDRQARLLAAVGAALLLPRSVGTAQQVGPAMKGSAATDLGARDFVAWSSERFESPTSTRCIAKGARLDPKLVGRLLGTTATLTRPSICTDRSLNSPIPDPVASLAAAAGRNVESVIAWSIAVSWLTLTLTVLTLVLTTESFAVLSRRIRSRSQPVLKGLTRRAFTAPPSAAPAPPEQDRPSPTQESALRREAAPPYQPGAEARPQAAASGVAAQGTARASARSAARRLRSATGELLSTLVTRIRRGAGVPRIAERLEAHREQSSYRRLERRGLARWRHRRADALVDRLAESRERRREKRRRSRGARGQWFAWQHLDRLEGGSPPLAAYVAAAVMVTAAAAAVIALLLGL